MRRVVLATAASLAAVAWARHRRHSAIDNRPQHDEDEEAAMTTTIESPPESKRRRLSRRVIAMLAAAISLQLVAGIATAVPLKEAADAAEFAAAVLPAPAPDLAPRELDDVAPPIRIDIPRLAVSAPVDEIGLAEDGTVDVPKDFGRTGWFKGLEAPGEVGTAVIVGHLDSYTGPAVFFRANELKAGDEILVARADGSTVKFVVERTEQYKKRDFPTIAVYAPTDRPTLRLITCGGTFDKKRRSYLDNVVVYASAVEQT